MTTKMIGVRQFTKNISKFLRQSQEQNVHYVVLRHGRPVANVTPINEVTDEELEADGFDLDELRLDVSQARLEHEKGETYSTDEVRAMLAA